MRKFKSLLKPYLRKILHDSRKAVGISQEQMAALLRISPRCSPMRKLSALCGASSF